MKKFLNLEKKSLSEALKGISFVLSIGKRDIFCYFIDFGSGVQGSSVPLLRSFYGALKIATFSICKLPWFTGG